MFVANVLALIFLLNLTQVF